MIELELEKGRLKIRSRYITHSTELGVDIVSRALCTVTDAHFY